MNSLVLIWGLHETEAKMGLDVDRFRGEAPVKDKGTDLRRQGEPLVLGASLTAVTGGWGRSSPGRV